MSLTPGARLGPYEIMALAGAGGMGEVYRARDTRLDRTVALKISAQEFSERFEREARSVAALNHPHICTLYDVGPNYLVMEYIEGAPLKGPLPLDEALRLSAQIADALDAAHRKGIVHRDLKPANVLVTKSGVKLLDFGLAKALAPAIGEETVTKALTTQGTLLGTLQYMSPEQLQGAEADARSDIFAFGLVLYEMLTGRRAFEASSQASVIGAILHTEPPPVASTMTEAPPALDRLIRKCLAKDPENRWQSARDLSGELRWIAEAGPDAVSPALASRRSRREWLGWAAAAVLGVVAAAALAVAVRHVRETPPPQPVVRFRVEFPEGFLPGYIGLSPDGSRLLLADRTQGGRLWVRNLDSPVLHPLPGTEGAGNAVFSPDGRSIAFRSGSSLRRLDLVGGAIQTLCQLRGGNSGPQAWNRAGVLLVSEDSVLKQVSASGGVLKPATALDTASGDTGHFFASFLPDGRRFIYFAYSNTPTGATYVGSLDDPKFHKRLLQGTGPARYAPPGWLLYARDEVLFAQPFDAAKLELSGEPAPIAEQVGGSSNISGFAYTSSDAGSLAWGLGSSTKIMQLKWFDRAGKSLATVGDPGEIANPVLSPDGKRVLLTIRDPGTKTRDLWILDLDRAVTSRLTFDPAEDFNPVWSPDGSQVFFSSNRKGHKDLYRRRADGVGGDEELLVSEDDKNIESLSPDGKYLLFNVTTPGKAIGLQVLPLTGERKPSLFAQAAGTQNYGQFSPDGRWIAYMSSESGRGQIFVQSAPGSNAPPGKWQVSNAGGLMPQWRRDGKELFFLANMKLMAVPVKSGGASFESGTPVPLFDTRPGVSLRNHFTATPDGQRFLFSSPKESDNAGQVHILLNWPSQLRKP